MIPYKDLIYYHNCKLLIQDFSRIGYPYIALLGDLSIYYSIIIYCDDNEYLLDFKEFLIKSTFQSFIHFIDI